MSNPIEFPKQLRDKEVAEILNVTPVKLRQDRFKKIGPPCRKYGGAVRYDEKELYEWMNAQSSMAAEN